MSATGWAAFGSAIANDFLMARLMSVGPLKTPQQELRMTAVRRKALLGATAPLELLSQLSIQCFLNEYAWRVTEEEGAEVAALRARIEDGSRHPAELLLLACYQPLGELACATQLLGIEEPTPLRVVVGMQVRNLLEERLLREKIDVITPIRRGVSEYVQQMYEENPYPRWILPSLPSGWSPSDLPASPHVLIAGCGTGKHAIQSSRLYPSGRLLAVDLSRASLAYGVRKAAEIGATNIRFAQADILELGGLNLSFDLIEAIGSLHHMEDPAEGLRTLVGLLRPGGYVALGLYSAVGRRPLIAAQEFGARYPRTAEGIRKLRADIIDAPAEDPIREPVNWSDFYSTSTCRDLLLHVQEHKFNVSGLLELLNEARLVFRGFRLSAGVLRAYESQFPDDIGGLNLMNWEVFEERHPTTFRRMYQLWAQKVA